MRLRLVTLFTLVAAVGAGQDQKPDLFAPIRERVRQSIAKEGVPSISVAVARGGAVVWEESFGWADRENRVPATPNTMYTLGSVAKPMTATALLLLRQRGLLDLDRPINEYLGDAKIVARVGSVREVTVRRVAQHSAGLPGYYETFYPDEAGTPPTIDNVILRYGKIMFLPGEKFHYSNLGYGILGSVVARIAKTEYASFMRDEVFRPLGLTHSSVTIPPSSERAVRYFVDGARLPDYTTPHPAASDIYASVHDLVRFGMFHMKERLSDRETLLPAEAIDEMQRPAILIPPGKSYGLGWLLSQDAKGRRLVGHGGAAAGVDAQLTLVPKERLALAVLANKNVDHRVCADIADAILDLMLGDSPQSRLSPESAPATEPSAAGFPRSIVGRWSGRVSTFERDVPVSLAFDESGAAEAQLGEAPKTVVRGVKVSHGVFTGRMTGDIGTPDARRRPYDLDWNVMLRGDVLNGVLYAIGHHPSRGVLLGYWVELRRVQ